MQHPTVRIQSVYFGTSSDEERDADAHINVTNFRQAFEKNRPVPEGTFSPYMGTTHLEYDCLTCLNKKSVCPGHPGKLMLNFPLMNPLQIKEIEKYLKVICYHCSSTVLDLKADISEHIRKLDSRKKINHCHNCHREHMVVELDSATKTKITRQSKDSLSLVEYAKKADPLYADRIKTIFSKITTETMDKLNRLHYTHPKNFIISVMQVPPNTIRPDIRKLDDPKNISSNEITKLINEIAKRNATLPARFDATKIEAINEMQALYNEMIDGSSSASAKLRSESTTSDNASVAIINRFPKKTGRFRGNLLGKRVNSVGRSCIIGDPYLKIDEVGIPLEFARKISVRETVQDYNISRILGLWEDGQIRRITKPNGEVIRADFLNTTINIGDVVHRDLQNGDYCALNRQPSLWIGSLNVHKIVIHEGLKTICINVLACPPYNADFDGDTMICIHNTHLAYAFEARTMASPEMNYNSVETATPIYGEAQDSIIGLAMLTRSDVRISRYNALQIFGNCTVTPIVPEDKEEFTGRDLITMLFQAQGTKINYSTKANFYKSEVEKFGMKYKKEDVEVVIRNGVHISGVIDKASVGEGRDGTIFRVIYDFHGPKKALDTNFNLQQIGLRYLYFCGFTVNLRDLIINDITKMKISETITRIINEAEKINDQLKRGEIVPPVGINVADYYELKITQALKDGDEFWESIFTGTDVMHNSIALMILFGSKGNLAHYKSIFSCLGQSNLLGKRPPNVGGRSSIHYPKYDHSPEAGGYICNGYANGLSASEMPNTMAETRVNLVEIALGTATTGAQNRRSTKGTENGIVNNFRSVCKYNMILQPIYGTTGCDPRMLKKIKIFQASKKNLKDYAEMMKANVKMFNKKYQKGVEKIIEEEWAQLVEDRDLYRSALLDIEVCVSTKMYSEYQMAPFNPENIINNEIARAEDIDPELTNPDNLNPVEAYNAVKQFNDDLVYLFSNSIQQKRKTKMPDCFYQGQHICRLIIRGYLCLAQLHKRRITNSVLTNILNSIRKEYRASLVDPGTAVGILAAQSYSHSATQSVLNSKHAVGVGVGGTQGFWRILEIFNATPTKKMQLPQMRLSLKQGTTREEAKHIANTLCILNFRDFIYGGGEILSESIDNLIYPEYLHEKQLIKEFEKYNPNVKRPADLINWCIRFELDKIKMISKRVYVNDIYLRLQTAFPNYYIVYNSDNSDRIVMRIYIRSVAVKNVEVTTPYMIKLMDEICDLIIRGIDGIKYAEVREVTRNIDRDGEIVQIKTNEILTHGSNYAKILEIGDDIFDIANCFTNSFEEIFQCLGIGAAHNLIINEMHHQFSAASYQHYEIYANEMTQTGDITAINRHGSKRRYNSILTLVSEASPRPIFKTASAIGTNDEITKSVSACVMMAQPPPIGTTYNDLEIDSKFVAENTESASDLLDAI